MRDSGREWRGVVAFGVAVLISLASVPDVRADAYEDEEPCNHVKGSKKDRPRSFNAHGAGLVSGSGFLVAGTFPAGLDGDGCAAADGAATAGTIRRRWGFGLAHYYHPPLTVEERAELDQLVVRCPPDGKPNRTFLAVHKYRMDTLKAKLRLFEVVSRELALTAYVGTTAFKAQNFTMQLEVLREAGKPGELLTVTEADVLRMPHLWKRWFRPITMQGTFTQVNAPRGQVPAVATACVKFETYDGGYCGFGSFQVAGAAASQVMCQAGWAGRQKRPAWHAWCIHGREDAGEWDNDADVLAELKALEKALQAEAAQLARQRDEVLKCAEAAAQEILRLMAIEEEKKKQQQQQQQQEQGKGNNGVGNGADPQPPGSPRPNDGEGTAPGNPSSAGGKADGTTAAAGKEKSNEGGSK